MIKFAYCDRAGIIEISQFEAIPSGVIVFAHGDAADLETKVSAVSRHGYDGTLLVPGVPEAASTEDALSSFDAWHRWAFPDQVWNLHVFEGDPA